MKCLFPATVAFILASSVAMAHAFLEHASPSAGAAVAAPSSVNLSFSEDLEPAFSGVTVTDAFGHDVTSGVPTIAGVTMNVPLKPLHPGNYRVMWHALSVDTHRTQGAYTFTVKP